MLTLEWAEGARLVNREQIRLYNADPAKLVDTLVQCSLRQMLEVGGRWWLSVAVCVCVCVDVRSTVTLTYKHASRIQNGFFHADPHAGNLLCTVRSSHAHARTHAD